MSRTRRGTKDKFDYNPGKARKDRIARQAEHRKARREAHRKWHETFSV